MKEALKDDLNKAWLAGYAAYRQGLTKDNSPYKYCSDEDTAWTEGYKAAKFCDVPGVGRKWQQTR